MSGASSLPCHVLVSWATPLLYGSPCLELVYSLTSYTWGNCNHSMLLTPPENAFLNTFSSQKIILAGLQIKAEMFGCRLFTLRNHHMPCFRASVHIIGVSLSEPHPSVTSLHPCVCMYVCLVLACLLGPTTYHMSLLALILCVLHHVFIRKRFNTWTMNRLQSSYLLDGNDNNGDHSWTYLFSG